MRIPTLIALLVMLAPAVAQAPSDANKVDLELVLAVDISYSMDVDELRVQRDGYTSALVSKAVLDAIAQGPYGRIAVAYVEWAGVSHQAVAVDWQVIEGAESAQNFADKLAEVPPNRSFRTSISGAIAFSAALFAKNSFAGSRQVIDVSGDGPNNQGNVVSYARDQAVAQGIGINGLPLLLKAPRPGSMDVPDLEAYYRDCVIGGPGAFVIPVREPARFAEAIRTKLVLEISAQEPPARVLPAQAQSSGCMIGEKIWTDRYGEGIGDWQ